MEMNAIEEMIESEPSQTYSPPLYLSLSNDREMNENYIDIEIQQNRTEQNREYSSVCNVCI